MIVKVGGLASHKQTSVTRMSSDRPSQELADVWRDILKHLQEDFPEGFPPARRLDYDDLLNDREKKLTEKEGPSMGMDKHGPSERS